MPRTILIVDDNDAYRGVLASLISLRGYQVVTARNGTEGLAVAATRPIDAALVDVEMPGMDGFEFCGQLQAQCQGSGKNLPVWIMTGVLRPALNKKAAQAGAILVLRKPFHAEEFVQRCEEEFQARAAAARPNPPETPGS